MGAPGAGDLSRWQRGVSTPGVQERKDDVEMADPGGIGGRSVAQGVTAPSAGLTITTSSPGNWTPAPVRSRVTAVPG